MSYYLYRIDYDQGDFGYTEHYVLEAENEDEAKERLLEGLRYWYVGDGIEPDGGGVFDNGDNTYSGEVIYEVTPDFVAQCPPIMNQFNFGRKP